MAGIKRTRKKGEKEQMKHVDKWVFCEPTMRAGIGRDVIENARKVGKVIADLPIGRVEGEVYVYVHHNSGIYLGADIKVGDNWYCAKFIDGVVSIPLGTYVYYNGRLCWDGRLFFPITLDPANGGWGEFQPCPKG